MWHSLRYGFRLMRKGPGFTAIAVMTLGLGIGANTAIFSVLRATLLSGLPLRDPDRLFLMLRIRRDARGSWDFRFRTAATNCCATARAPSPASPGMRATAILR